MLYHFGPRKVAASLPILHAGASRIGQAFAWVEVAMQLVQDILGRQTTAAEPVADPRRYAGLAGSIYPQPGLGRRGGAKLCSLSSDCQRDGASARIFPGASGPGRCARWHWTVFSWWICRTRNAAAATFPRIKWRSSRSMSGNTARTESELIGQLLRQHQPGDTIPTTVLRGDERIELSLPIQ